MRAELGRFALLSCLINVYFQGASSSALLDLSSNPVYSGQPVALTCSYGQGKRLINVTVDAFDGDLSKKGSLSCDVRKNITKTSGVFSGSSLVGCPTSIGGSTNVSVTVNASTSLDLRYNCTVAVASKAVDASKAFEVHQLSSASTHLIVLVFPSMPAFVSRPIVFSKSDNATIICKSHGGKPSADINVTVTSSNGKVASASGSDAALLELPSPLTDWNNATAECAVTNHNFSIKAVSSEIFVNYISDPHISSAACISTNFPMPDCSAYADSFGPFSHTLRLLPEANLSSPLRTMFGLMNCISPPASSGKIIVLIFLLSDEKHCPFIDSQSNNVSRSNLFCEEDQAACTAMGISVAIVILVVAALVVIGKKGLFSRRHRERNPCLRLQVPMRYMLVDDNSDIPMTDNVIYSGLPAGVAQACHETGGSRYGFQANCKDRLVIAAREVVGDIATLLSPSTVLVEFSDTSNSLEEILAKVQQAIEQSSALKFKNVSLLLRSVERGVILSEIDHTVLSCKNVIEDGVNIRDFLTRLAEMSLDHKSSEATINIINYKGEGAFELGKSLSDFVTVPLVVTSDIYVTNRSTGQESYVNIYEEIGEPAGRLSSQAPNIETDLE